MSETLLKPIEPKNLQRQPAVIDLFPVEEEQQDDLFPVTETQQNPFTPSGTDDRAFYAALAVEPLQGDEAFASIVARNKELIETGRENIINEQARQQRTKRSIEATVGLQNDLLFQPNSSELIKLFGENIADIQTREDNAALEKEAVQRLQDLMVEDPFQAALFVDRIKQGDLLDRQLKHATKLVIFQREADKLRAEVEGQEIAESVANFLLSIVDLPLSSLGEVLNIEAPLSEDTKRKLFEAPSQKKKQAAANIWDPSVSVDEFDAMIRQAAQVARNNSGVIKDNAVFALQDFESLRGLNNSDALTYDVFIGLDVASLPGVGVVAKAITTPVRTAKAVANRAAAIKGAAGDLLSPSTNPVKNAMALREALPNSIVPDLPGFVDPTVGLSGDLANRLAAIQRIRAGAADIIVPERLAPEQFAQATADKVEDLVNQFQDFNILDVKAVTGTDDEVLKNRFQVGVDRDTGVRNLTLYLGRKTGEGGYLTEAAAKNAATRMGFDLPDVKITHTIDDRFAIKVMANVPEIGVTKPTIDIPSPLSENSVIKTKLAVDQLGNTGRIGAWFKNPDSSSVEMFARAIHLSEGVRSRLRGNVVKPLLKPLSKLTKKQSNDIETILVMGEREQKRYNIEELYHFYENTFKREPTDNELVAYYAVQELQDFNWDLFNTKQFADKARRGMETIKVFDESDFNTLRRNGIVVSPSETRTQRVYDLEDQRSYTPGSNEEAFAKKVETGNYNLVRLEGEYNFAGEDIKYILTHKRSMTRGPLQRQQMGYIPGGPRIYKGRFPVKQANSVEFKDGTMVFKNPLTHFIVDTELEAKTLAANLETARIAYNNFQLGAIDIDAVERIIGEATSMDFTKFDKLVKEGKIHTKHKFEALFDRTQPTEMTGVGVDRLWVDEFDTGATEYYNTTGRLFYSAKGEHLLNPDLERAEILKPFKALERAVNTAIDTRALADYATFATEEWARIASKFIRKGQFSENPAPFTVFMKGELDANFVRNSPKAAAALEANRDVIKRFLGTQTQALSRKEMAQRSLSNWLDGPSKKGQRNLRRIAAKKSMDLLDTNPVNAVNAAVFHSQFGFYDPGQLILQTQTAVGALAISPIYGGPAVALYPFIRLAIINGTNPVLDYIAKNAQKALTFTTTRGEKFTGMPPEEFKLMIKTLLDAGEKDIGGSALQSGRFHTDIGGAGVIKSALNILGKGRLFFDEAERLNRIVAWQIAWRKTKDAFPNLPVDSKEFAGRVKFSTSAFGQSMRDSSAAQWQKGALAPATRFQSYQARLLENMLPKKFGGNPQFSAGQKLRLALGQAALFGTAGLPIVDYVASQWKQYRGEDLSPDQWRILTKGFYDNFLFGITGGELDTDFASRAGIGRGWTQTIENLLNGDRHSFLQTLGGPTLAIGGDVFESFDRVATYGRAGLTDSGITQETFKLIAGDLANNINSLERYNKAALIWRYQKILDKKTGEPIVDADSLDGFAALLGIPLTKEKDVFEQFKAVANRQDEIEKNAILLVKLNNEFFDAMAVKDERKMDNTVRLRAAIMQSFSDDPLMQQQIANRAVALDSRVLDKATFAREQYEKIIGKKFPTDVDEEARQ